MGSSLDKKADKNESRILCVDDDSQTADWIRLALKGSRTPITVDLVDSGREAFRKLNSERYDLCIVEYALPDMTGVQLCSLMRHMGSDIPIVFFTAMNRSVDKAKATEAGATEYLIKPDDLEIFVDSVTHLLKKGGTAIYRRMPEPQSRPRVRMAA